ncbi:Hypothetical protein CINCED_3A020475 [Cinara cedri]|nr:Hypothetical protein CINCED_3A020475 [Cinara cedri]
MEICVDSIESGVNAAIGGAHRLELCSSLIEGGLTPSLGLFKTLKSMVTIPIFVMLRPRGGYDFQFSDSERKVVLQDLTLFKEAGADGFVFGALNACGGIDVAFCESVILASSPLPVTFHRAFDVATENPIIMAQKIAELGFTRLLTSGRRSEAINGILLIKTLIEKMKGRLIIIPGAGIKIENLKAILSTTSAHEFHGSAKILKQFAYPIDNLFLNNETNPVYITHCETVKQLLKIYNDYYKQYE